MAYTDFIAAIDLGSSHMVGMVGAKGPAGTLSIIAYEVENSDTCIRRGCVYNIKDAAGKIVRLIRKLENKLGGSRIGKIYVGVGGQSLRSINHAVSKVLGSGTVTEEVLKELDQECRQYRPDMLDVLDIAAPVYYLDNQPETHPIGLGCSRIEAHYKLLVGRPSLRHAVTTNMAEQIKLDVAGVVVAPLALADLILTEQEKLKGCALIDFGAGVTSVTVYKDGSLAGLYVIPLGSHLITRDLMSLGMPEKEAERVKHTYGNAIWEKDNEQQMVTVDLADGQHSSEINLSDINRPEYQDKIMRKYGFHDWNSCLATVGHGGLKEGQIVNRMYEEYKKDHLARITDEEVLETISENKEKVPEKKSKSGIIVKGLYDVAVHFSKCCSPVPGDEIVGFVTRGRGVSIHRTDCINIINLSDMERERLIDAEWQHDEESGNSGLYLAEIKVFCNNRTGLLVDITRAFTERAIDINAIHSKTSKQGIATIDISFNTKGKAELTSVIDKLRQIDSIIDIERTTG